MKLTIMTMIIMAGFLFGQSYSDDAKIKKIESELNKIERELDNRPRESELYKRPIREIKSDLGWLERELNKVSIRTDDYASRKKVQGIKSDLEDQNRELDWLEYERKNEISKREHQQTIRDLRETTNDLHESNKKQWDGVKSDFNNELQKLWNGSLNKDDVYHNEYDKNDYRIINPNDGAKVQEADKIHNEILQLLNDFEKEFLD